MIVSDIRELQERLKAQGGGAAEVERSIVCTEATNGPVTFSGVTFRDSVTLDGLHITGACRFEECRFERGLLFRNARIAGDLFIVSCVFGSEGPASEDGIAMNLSGTEVAGTLSIKAPQVVGRADLDFVVVNADCELTDPDVRSDLTMRGLKVRGDLRVVAAAGSSGGADPGLCAQRVGGSMQLSRAAIDGALTLQGFSIGRDLDMRGAVIGLDLSLCGELGSGLDDELFMHVPHILDLSSCRIGADVELCNIRTQEMRLSSADIGGRLTVVDVEAPHISAGTMRIDAVDWRARFGDLHFAQSEVRTYFYGSMTANTLNMWGARCGSLLLDCTIHRVDLDHLRVTSLTVSSGSVGESVPQDVWGSREKSSWSLRAIEAESVELQGDFQYPLYLDGLRSARLSIGSAFDPTRLAGGAYGRDIVVSGRTEVKNTKIGRRSADGKEEPAGLHLTAGNIGTDLVIAACRIHGAIDLSDTVVGRSIVVEHAANAAQRVTCGQVRLIGARCEGDVQLSSLEIRPRGELLAPDFLGRNLSVRGRLELADIEPTSAGSITLIPGRLDLAGAQIAHLLLSGRGMDAAGESSGEISLERARVGRLQISDPLPRRIDLSSIHVDRWDLPRNDYEGLLSKTPEFKSSVYTAIEATLINQGDDDTAARIYRAMRWRALEDGQNVWRRAWGKFLGVTTGFGTQSWRVVWMMLALFAVSTWLFYDERNVMPSPSALEALGDDLSIHTVPEQWTLGSAAWLGLRYAVPIVPVFAEWEWSAADRPLALTGTGYSSWLMSAEDYSMFVHLLSWGLWPLYLASVAGFIKRRGE
jgi:hypothetical protein